MRTWAIKIQALVLKNNMIYPKGLFSLLALIGLQLGGHKAGV